MTSIKEISKQVWTGLQEGNKPLLTQTIHPEAVFVHMGGTFTRDQEIDIVVNKGIIYKEVTFEDQQIINTDTISIVLNTLTLVAIVNNNEVTNRFVVSEVYEKGETNTLLISMSFTKIVY